VKILARLDFCFDLNLGAKKREKTRFVPWVRAILDSFLSIFSPSVSIFKVINLTLGHEGKPWLLLLLLSFLLLLVPVNLPKTKF